VVSSEEKLEELKDVESFEKLEEPSPKPSIPPHLLPPEVRPWGCLHCTIQIS